MKKTNYESLLDAFRELGDVSDDEILTPQTKRLVKEGKEFVLGFRGEELDAAKAALEDADKDDEIEVIDVNADTLEHIKDKKEYVGQVILRCNKCHANRFIDMDKLVADEVDPEIYNVEDECPNCHTEGDGFEIIGQVGKIAKEEPVVEPEEEEVRIENDDPVESDVGFENDHTEEEATEVEDEPEQEPERTAADELDYVPEKEDDGMTTTASEDEDDDIDLPALGDKFDADNVRKDDTEEDDDEDEEEDDEDEVKEELKPVEDDVKPVVKRKLRLPTRAALARVRKARVATTEELFNKVALTESINKVIVSSGSKKIYEGLVEELPEDILKGNIEGFDVANGFLMCNVDPITADVDTPLAKVLNCFVDDTTTKIVVWDADTSEELFQGSKAEVLQKFGHCQLVSLDAPKTLRVTIKGEHKCSCIGDECTCEYEAEESPEEVLLNKIFKANNMAKFNSDDQRSEEFWVTESVYNKEDLKFVFERYIKGMSKDLVEEFKHVTGYKDEVDQFVDNHGVKLVRADEAFTKAEFDEMMKLAAEVGIKTVAELQEFSKQVGGAKDQNLLAALKKAVELKNNPEEVLEENVKSFKTRKALSEALSKIKGKAIDYKVRRSIKEGYRYDLVVEDAQADVDAIDYMQEAERFVKEIKVMPLAKAENFYYKDYNFPNHDPEDAAEQLIADALIARITEITGEDPREAADQANYLEEANKFAEEIKQFSLRKAEELYYDDYGFDTSAPEDDAEKVIFDALVARIVEISTKEPVIAGKAVQEDFEEEDFEEEDIEFDPASFELDEEFEEETGDEFADNIAHLSNAELEAIAKFDEVIKFFEKKGIAEEEIIDKLKEMQEDEEDHLDELKELFKAVTGEDLVEIEEDDVEDDVEDAEEEDDVEDDGEDDVELQTELELVDVDPAASEAPVDEAVEAEAEIEDEAPEAEPEEEPEVAPEEKEPLPDAIDVIKDKLDVEREGDVVVVAEKGQLDNPDALKVEVEVTEEEAEVLEDEFHEEEAEEDVEEEQPAEEIVQEDPDGNIVKDDEQMDKVEESYSRQELIDAVMDAFGFTKGEALEYIKKASEETKQNIVKGFRQDAKKNFYEGVSPNNPFLRSALDKLKLVKKAKGVVVSFRKPNGKEEEVGFVYYTPKELHELEKELRAEHGEDIDISAIHDRAMIDEYEQAMTEAVVDIKPFFTKVLEDEPKQDREVDFDTDMFDKDINEYFDSAYEESVLYTTESGMIDAQGNVVLEGLLNGEHPITFTLTPEKILSESVNLEEEIKAVTFKVVNNLSEEVFTFNFTGEK